MKNCEMDLKRNVQKMHIPFLAIRSDIKFDKYF